jgi:glucose-6-phosphate 1-epimerase
VRHQVAEQDPAIASKQWHDACACLFQLQAQRQVIMSHAAIPLPNHLLRLHSRDGAQIAVSLFGGQLCSWQTADGMERLFVSSRSHWNNRAPIRGGVPIIFPQFGAAGTGPRHGFARTLPWTLLASLIDDTDDGVMRLGLATSAASRQFSDAEFSLTLELRFTARNLLISLDIDNTGTTPLPFCAALHTYLRTDIPTASIHGLQHATYRDATDGGTAKIDTAAVRIIDQEIDRMYLQTSSEIVLRSDAGIINVSQVGFTDTVVWNPWIDKTSALVDCAPSDYLEFICIEAAVADRTRILLPGQRWRGAQELGITD